MNDENTKNFYSEIASIVSELKSMNYPIPEHLKRILNKGSISSHVIVKPGYGLVIERAGQFLENRLLAEFPISLRHTIQQEVPGTFYGNLNLLAYLMRACKVELKILRFNIPQEQAIVRLFKQSNGEDFDEESARTSRYGSLANGSTEILTEFKSYLEREMLRVDELNKGNYKAY